ncbi:hypothetical protein J4221_02125 [Candidatus Pacearchaeota archaeon]|nr:hypothetical protein [Candidatus Pacearchaeota archaeon]
MGLELMLQQQEYKKTPIEAYMNLRNGKLRIFNHEILMGGYFNVIGPQEINDKWLLSFVYPNKKHEFVKECAERIAHTSNLRVEMKENSDKQEVYVLDIYFPRNSFIIVATYHVQRV